jgi:predicted transcriptional regulator
MLLYTGEYDMLEMMTIRVDQKTKRRLEKLADATERTKSFLAAEALRSYLDLNEWQIQEIRAGVREADAGDFASDTEVEATFAKWRRRAR